MNTEVKPPTEQPNHSQRKSWFRRPRFQYSISTLLLLTAVLALWLGYVTHRARKQREAVAALSAIGARINYDWEYGTGKNKGPAGPAWLRKLIGDEYFQKVVSVSLSGRNVANSEDSEDDWDDPFAEDASSSESITLGEKDLAYLNNFPRLRSLTIAMDCPGLPDGFWNCVPNLEKLAIESYGDSAIGDSDLSGIGSLQNLTSLYLLGLCVSDERYAEIGELRKLETLTITDLSVTDQGLSRLKELRNLKGLILNSAEITGSGLKHVRDLESLQISSSSFSKNGSVHLQHMQSLQHISLSCDRISDEVLSEIGHLKELRIISISSKKMTSHDLTDWGDLDKLEILKLPEMPLCQESIEEIGKMSALHTLTAHCKGLSDEDMKFFGQLKTVTDLYLVNPTISEKGFAHLKAMPKLKRLVIKYSDETPNEAERKRIEKNLQGIQVEWTLKLISWW